MTQPKEVVTLADLLKMISKMTDTDRRLIIFCTYRNTVRRLYNALADNLALKKSVRFRLYCADSKVFPSVRRQIVEHINSPEADFPVVLVTSDVFTDGIAFTGHAVRIVHFEVTNIQTMLQREARGGSSRVGGVDW